MLRHNAIYLTHDTVVTIRGDGADEKCYDKDGNVVSINESTVTAKLAETEYQDKRKEEYPSIESQLDDIYHNGVDGWKATIKAVKDKYPK
tara:strand:+ start:556 stop:825 length:270 start_codon:yes stop_codon:yes gene_type:complete